MRLPSAINRQSSSAKDRARGSARLCSESKETSKEAPNSDDAQSDPKESRRARKARAREEQKAEKNLQPSAQHIIAGASEDGTMSRLNPESDTGPVEHKWRLKRPAPVRFQQLVGYSEWCYRIERLSLIAYQNYVTQSRAKAVVDVSQVTQLKFRLGEGNGECFYYVGVHDDGSLVRGKPDPLYYDAFLPKGLSFKAARSGRWAVTTWSDDGGAVLQVGLSEEDLAASLDTLHLMASEAGAKASVLRRLKGGSGRRCAIVRITRAALRQLSCTDLRIAGDIFR